MAFEFLRRGLGQQTDFPVTRVVAERDGGAIWGADPTLGAQDEVFVPSKV